MTTVEETTPPGVPLSTDLDSPQAYPYFLWDDPMTNDELRRRLVEASPPNGLDSWPRSCGKRATSTSGNTRNSRPWSRPGPGWLRIWVVAGRSGNSC